MSEQLADRYRSAAAQLTQIADQMPEGPADSNLPAAVRRVFDELIASEPSPQLRALLDERAQQLAGAAPFAADAFRDVVRALNHVAGNYEEQAHRFRGLWS